MIVNEVVILAYFCGGLAVVLSTISRYILPKQIPLSKVKRLVRSFRLISINENFLEFKAMIYQFTGFLWLLSGTVYGFVSSSFQFRGIDETIFKFVILVGPGLLMFGIMRMLGRIFGK